MNIVRKEIVEGHELKLRTHPDGDKWMVTRKRHLVSLISMLPTKRYHLDFWYSKYGYTLIEDFDTLDDAWKKIKEYIFYFKLYLRVDMNLMQIILIFTLFLFLKFESLRKQV